MTCHQTMSRTTHLKSTLLLLVSLVTIAGLVACSSSKSNQNNSITVSLSTVPTSIQIGATQKITATVANDSANAGVSWSCTPAGSCGSFSANKSGSGTAVTYTAPGSVPSGTVVITATSVTDTTKSASTPAITITSGITVTLSTTPTSLAVDGTLSITATVANDSANAGVSWSCTPAGSCGSFSASKSASGTAVTYTAPGSVPSGTVVITATSVTDTTKNASTPPITITTLLTGGNYVFYLSGTFNDPTKGPSAYFYTGAFAVNGNGQITGGEQDFSDADYFVSGVPGGTPASEITGGSVTRSADGNLTITLTSADQYITNKTGSVTIDASPVSSSKAVLIESDSWATGTGELDLQASNLAAPSGGYAYFASGGDYEGYSMSLGGVFNVDGPATAPPGPGTISGAGSVLDVSDSCPYNTFNSANTPPCTPAVFSNQSLASGKGTITGPDNYGYIYFEVDSNCSTGTYDQDMCAQLGKPGIYSSIVLEGFMIDANRMRLIENWHNDSIGAFIGGMALAQTGTGSFSTASLSGSSYVVSTTGHDSNGVLQAAGVLTLNSNGTVSGNLSFNDIAAQAPQGGTSITGGTYTVDPTGRVTLTGVTDGATFSYNFEMYLSGGSPGQAVLISMDAAAASPNVADVLGGLSWQQATGLGAASLSGNYGVAVAQFAGGKEQDGVGMFTADGKSNLTGFLDYNLSLSGGSLSPNNPFNLTFTASSINGVFKAANNKGLTFTSYLVDTTQGVVIENDNSQLNLGYFTNK